MHACVRGRPQCDHLRACRLNLYPHVYVEGVYGYEYAVSSMYEYGSPVRVATIHGGGDNTTASCRFFDGFSQNNRPFLFFYLLTPWSNCFRGVTAPYWSHCVMVLPLGCHCGRYLYLPTVIRH